MHLRPAASLSYGVVERQLTSTRHRGTSALPQSPGFRLDDRHLSTAASPSQYALCAKSSRLCRCRVFDSRQSSTPRGRCARQFPITSLNHFRLSSSTLSKNTTWSHMWPSYRHSGPGGESCASQRLRLSRADARTRPAEPTLLLCTILRSLRHRFMDEIGLANPDACADA